MCGWVGTRECAGCRGGSSSVGGCAGQAGAPDESTLELYVAWESAVCVASVYACRAVSECALEGVAVWRCVTDVEGLGWVSTREWAGCKDGSSTRCDTPSV